MAGISAILLAAGESTRMGRLKALLDWQGTTLLEWQVQTLLRAGASDVIVVLGHRPEEVGQYARGHHVRTVVNSQYKQGKTTSIKTGLKALSTKAKSILLLAVDQPRPLAIVKQVIQEHMAGNSLITAPRYQGHGGHPLALDISLKPELEAITEEKQGIREVMDGHRSEIRWIDVDTPIVRLDLNTPQDYEQAKSLFAEMDKEKAR